ncbi:hypothetical protein HDV00_006028 [Rhizophlyctis rosea]|nr:hypothetical protein HDV00_006028 [Rhizophlyctis rosea]
MLNTPNPPPHSTTGSDHTAVAIREGAAEGELKAGSSGNARKRKSSVSKGRGPTSSHSVCGPVLAAHRRKDQGIFIVGNVLILVLSTLHAVFVVPFFVERYSAAIPVVFAILWIFTLAAYFRTSFTDPGFLPRNVHPNPNPIEPPPSSAPQPAPGTLLHTAFNTQTQNENSPSSPPVAPPTSSPTTAPQPSIPNPAPPNQPTPNQPTPLPPSYPFLPTPDGHPPATYRTTLINNIQYRIKYCPTCQIWRPPRTSHCPSCDRCVEIHDHHCPWMANCVGKRNYRYFYAFLLSCTALALWVFGFSLAQLLIVGRETNGGAAEAVRRHPVNVVLVFMTFIIGWSVAGMTGYHSWLISVNMSTHEMLRKAPFLDGDGGVVEGRRPFDRGGCWRNCVWVLCRGVDPSLDFDRENLETYGEARVEVGATVPGQVGNGERGLRGGDGGSSGATIDHRPSSAVPGWAGGEVVVDVDGRVDEVVVGGSGEGPVEAAK